MLKKVVVQYKAKDFVRLPSKLPCYSIPNILDRRNLVFYLLVPYYMIRKRKIVVTALFMEIMIGVI